MQVPLLLPATCTDSQDSAVELVEVARESGDAVSLVSRNRSDGGDFFVVETGEYAERIMKFLRTAVRGFSGSSMMTFSMEAEDAELGDRNGFAMVSGVLTLRRKGSGACSSVRSEVEGTRKMFVVWGDEDRPLRTRDHYFTTSDGKLGVYPGLLRFSMAREVQGVVFLRETMLNFTGVPVEVDRFVRIRCRRLPVAERPAGHDNINVFKLKAQVYERPSSTGFHEDERLFHGWALLAREAILGFEEEQASDAERAEQREADRLAELRAAHDERVLMLMFPSQPGRTVQHFLAIVQDCSIAEALYAVETAEELEALVALHCSDDTQLEDAANDMIQRYVDSDDLADTLVAMVDEFQRSA